MGCCNAGPVGESLKYPLMPNSNSCKDREVQSKKILVKVVGLKPALLLVGGEWKCDNFSYGASQINLP